METTQPPSAGQKSFSPTRLNEFVGCPHASALTLRDLEPGADQSAPPAAGSLDETTQLVIRLGFEHEHRVLEMLKKSGLRVVAVAQPAPIRQRLTETQNAMSAGVDLIYQGAVAHQRWFGYPDFLVRVQTNKGSSYEPADAKLARSARPEHLAQLTVYADALGAMTNSHVRYGTLYLGTGAAERYDLDEARYYIGRLQDRFVKFVDSPERDSRAWRCAACPQCVYQSKCEAEWRATDSLFFVANIQSRQIQQLEAAGVSTMQGLAQRDPLQTIGRIGPLPFARLVKQAAKQVDARNSHLHAWEFRDIEPGRGFTLLPHAADGDLFFDIEGDPFYPEGLDYLLGVFGPIDGTDQRFVPIWGHDHDAERKAFERLMDLFQAHFEMFPEARIYHYAAYETTALKRLAMRYATRESQLDQMLRERRFVDLYKVVRQGLIVSTEGYGLKDLEPVFGFERGGDIKTAGDSVVEYEQWRVTGDEAILRRIVEYNDIDCRSTSALRDWLVAIRPASASFSSPLVNDEDAAAERTLVRTQRDAARHALAERVRTTKCENPAVSNLVAELLWFHQRNKKPEYWAMFDRQLQSDEDLVDDIESIGDLRLDQASGHQPVKKSFLATFRFPPQETKLRAGKRVKIAATLEPAGAIEELDEVQGVVSLKRQQKSGEFPIRFSIIPSGPLDDEVIVEAVARFASRFADADYTFARPLLDILHRRPPNLNGRAVGLPIVPAGVELLSGSCAAIAALDHSYLFIQGPPGTGKTYTASQAIVDRLQAGARVAVTSNSHKAINNLLSAVEDRAREMNFSFLGAKKASQQDPSSQFDGSCVETVLVANEIHDGHRLVGGTAFLFSREDQEAGYDYLFVDEAGQVSLANLVAMSACARNIVLVGDQMQLPQPIKGIHPGDSGLSTLEYLLQGAATVSPTHGILLNISWRMHPKLNQFVSDAIYDGRLSARPENSRRTLVLDRAGADELRPAGIQFKAVAHTGCAQRSEEEATEISHIVELILRQQLVEDDGIIRPVTLQDIVVVAPYNMQVNLLVSRLPQGARVGTVDKFQGQEAAVSIVSMTTSSAEEAPRGAAFLFSKHRLNVAISRAKCLSIVVASPTLLDYQCRTLEEMKLVNLLCRMEAYAAQSS